MKYIQWISKSWARFPLFFIGVTAILACAWLPSAALALGIGSPAPTVIKIGSDSSKVTAPTNASPKKYSCSTNTDSSKITKVVVPCSGTTLASDVQNNNDYACPAGQVVVGSGTVDNGAYNPAPHFYNCQVSLMNMWSSSAHAEDCNGNTDYNYVYGVECWMSNCSPMYCNRGGCSWGGGVWVSKPSCYVKCAPQTDCKWQ